jgi:hypothetical protein
MSSHALWGASKEQRLAYRWAPKGSEEIKHPDGLGVVFISEYDKRDAAKLPAGRNTFQLVGYRGTAGRNSFNIIVSSREEADKYIAKWFESLEASKKFRSERRAERSKPHIFKVGDVVYNSWGYDQTNVDFYQVVKVTGHYVHIKPIKQDTTTTHCNGGHTAPQPGQFVENGEEEKHYATGAHVTFKHGSGSKWMGGNIGCSWGH